jgi:hypothetical protein
MVDYDALRRERVEQILAGIATDDANALARLERIPTVLYFKLSSDNPQDLEVSSWNRTAHEFGLVRLDRCFTGMNVYSFYPYEPMKTLGESEGTPHRTHAEAPLLFKRSMEQQGYRVTFFNLEMMIREA